MIKKTLLTIVLACTLHCVHAAEGGFDFDVLRGQAKELSTKPYSPAPSLVTEEFRKLTYDQYRDIRFKPEESVWRREKLPFQLQFFHLGFSFNDPVQFDLVQDGTPHQVDYEPTLFDYGKNHPLSHASQRMGFAGMKILYPLNKQGDELGAFLGASYFRFLCQHAFYGLSARALAINTGEAVEEWPVFRELWIERPQGDAKFLIIYALLDGPSVVGAYKFTIVPGVETITQVHAVVYCRHNPNVLGIAPLTSMFWHGKNTNQRYNDFRPEVHDSDGFSIHMGSGEWLWRPLMNPESTRTASFTDENPHGFGLFQRERQYQSYQDLEVYYQLRPNAWVEPLGAWGKGSVRLVELHAKDETSDNITVFWVPAVLPPPGEPIEVSYNVHWFLDGIHPPAGYVVSTRHGQTATQESDLERFVVDFGGPYLDSREADDNITPVVTVGLGATLVNTTIQKNPFDGTWRVAFALHSDHSGRPVEMRCFLKKPPHVLTETWSYLWQP